MMIGKTFETPSYSGEETETPSFSPQETSQVMIDQEDEEDDRDETCPKALTFKGTDIPQVVESKALGIAWSIVETSIKQQRKFNKLIV